MNVEQRKRLRECILLFKIVILNVTKFRDIINQLKNKINVCHVKLEPTKTWKGKKFVKTVLRDT